MKCPIKSFTPEDFDFDVIHEKHLCDPTIYDLAKKANELLQLRWKEVLENGIECQECTEIISTTCTDCIERTLCEQSAKLFFGDK